ncbi:MAG TPA: hypothetical protein VJ776_01810 [Thermoanaerobaculia bacterium]|nr:hypothetical protein [Thermoanaerobaculia bacterium]
MHRKTSLALARDLRLTAHRGAARPDAASTAPLIPPCTLAPAARASSLGYFGRLRAPRPGPQGRAPRQTSSGLAGLRRPAFVALLALLLVAPPIFAGVSQVRLKLPLRPRLPLRGNEKLALAPFILVTEAEKARDKRLQNVDLQGEFHRFLKKQVDKKTKLEVIETGPDVKLPTQNLTELARATEFWRSVGAMTGADILVSGSLEFRIEDRSGYKTEEYVSPINGQTYYRQVYVEQTGFLFDIVFLVFDGRTGEKLLQDEFKDFRQTGGRRADELQGLFENLFSLENQILNLFVAREREADRYLFTD